MPKIVVFVCSALSAAFVLWIGAGMPEWVASHFGPPGNPDGHMSRASFVPTMAVMAAGLPLAVWFLLRAQPSGRPTIPIAGPWRLPVVPSRRAVSDARAAALCIALGALLDFVTWRVGTANQEHGADHLSNAPMWTGLAAFLVFFTAWSFDHLRVRRRG